MLVHVVMFTVNTRISPLGANLFFGFLHGGLFVGGRLFRWEVLNVFIVVGHISVEICLLINYFFDSTLTSNKVFFKGQANFHLLMTAFSFLALMTNRLPNRYDYMPGWGLFEGGAY